MKKQGFSLLAILTPAFFYLLAAATVAAIAFNLYQDWRSQSIGPEDLPAVEEDSSDETPLTKAEEETVAGDGQKPAPAPQPKPKPEPEPTPAPAPSPSGPVAAGGVIRKVLVLDFDPIVESAGGQRLHTLLGWNNPQTLETSYIADVKSSSNNYVNYQIVQRLKLDDYPVKDDGFDYNDESFLDCWNSPGQSACHQPDGVDYHKLLTDYGADVCALRNSNQIHELWVWGAPYFGYYESRLAGPNAFWYNSPPLEGTSCTKQLPIMGFSYERGVAEMLENLGHRTESAMAHTYGGWEENRTSHNWDRFALVKAQSPNYSYSGCGSVHYAPNSVSDYDWGNPATVQSTCDDFYRYPSLAGTKKSVTCSKWGCDGYGYLKWWFRHIPHFTGTAPDGKWNNWWRYILDYREATALGPWQKFLAFWESIINVLEGSFSSTASGKN